MKIKANAVISVSDRFNEWTFTFIPTIYAQRSDMFADEAAYYIGIHWLVFNAHIRITRKKTHDE